MKVEPECSTSFPHHCFTLHIIRLNLSPTPSFHLFSFSETAASICSSAKTRRVPCSPPPPPAFRTCNPLTRCEARRQSQVIHISYAEPRCSASQSHQPRSRQALTAAVRRFSSAWVSSQRGTLPLGIISIAHTMLSMNRIFLFFAFFCLYDGGLTVPPVKTPATHVFTYLLCA